MAWDDINRTLGVIPDEDEEEVPPITAADLPAVAPDDGLQIDPALLAARDSRDEDLALANIMQGITQVGTSLGSQGRVRADGGAFDAVREAAQKRVDETSKDVAGRRKIISDAIKAKAAAANASGAEEWRKKNYEQRERDIKATAINKEKPTEAQNNSASYAKRLEQAEADFSEIGKSGYDRADNLSALGASLPGFMQSENAKRQEQAERNFVNALLRKESGAAISKDEFKNAELQYFPRAGDTDPVKQQKMRNRKQALESLKGSSGKAYSTIPLVGKESGGGFPRQVRKGNQTATVSNAAELEEANAEGFR